MKPGISRMTAYRKIEKTFTNTDDGQRALRAVGKLDELLSLVGFDKKVESAGYDTAFPEIADKETYAFSATDLRNPLLAWSELDGVVPNDFEIGTTPDNRLTFLTGPNSGGKSTLSKAVILNQLIGQLGGKVVAKKAVLSPADRVAYHIPMPPDLDEQTGRFGYELKQVRRILDTATEGSLTILDDCLDGTTHEERVIILKGLLLAFRNLTGATMFSTHAHELVESFEQHGVGAFEQVEFDNGRPTHRIIPGISHDSHARSVAEDYGLDETQLHKRVVLEVHDPVWF